MHRRDNIFSERLTTPGRHLYTKHMHRADGRERILQSKYQTETGGFNLRITAAALRQI